MESDSRFSYGGQPSASRMDRQTVDQLVAIPQHSTLSQPRMATGGVNPLDLTSAIEHELRRSNTTQHPGWAPWDHQQGPEFDGIRSYASSLDADSTGFSIPCGSFHSGGNANASQILPLYIPRFDERMGPALHNHMPNHRFEFTPETDSLGSAGQGFYSGSSRSGNGFAPVHHTQQVFETETAIMNPTRSCSPWIERMMQADVTTTPSPVNLCLSTSQGTMSCVLSQTVDLQSCHSSDRQAQSMRSAFSGGDPQHESTVELSADLWTDDDDLETRPLDVKRKKRMLSNRASAQRSRLRRQERLDQLEVLTAKLRVENSTLQKKLSTAIEVAKKFDSQNKDLLKKVDRLSKELEAGGKRDRKLNADRFNDCASSQQTACASSCDMVCERPGVDPNVMRDGCGASTGTQSGSPSRSPNRWPMGSYRSPPESNHSNGGSNAWSNGRTNQGLSSVRKSFSACRMESKKRSHEQFEGSFGETSPAAAAAAAAALAACSSEALETAGRPLWQEVNHDSNPLLGLDPSLKEDGDADCLEADRWLEFTDCFL